MLREIYQYLSQRRNEGKPVVRGLLVLLAVYLVVVYYYLFEPELYTRSLVAGLAPFVVYLAPIALFLAVIFEARRSRKRGD